MPIITTKIRVLCLKLQFRLDQKILKLFIICTLFLQKRDELLKHCLKKGIEAKVHYPIPIYRQEALKFLNHKKGDFPVTDDHTKKIITFPCDQHLKKGQLNYIIKTVSDFYIMKIKYINLQKQYLEEKNY